MGAVLLKSRLYQEAGWSPHPGQEKVIRSGARNKILSAGRRFGKSEVGAYDRLLPEALAAYANKSYILDSGKRHEYWIVGPEYTDGEKEFRKLYNALSRLGVSFDMKGAVGEGIGTRYNVESGDMSISLWGGAFYVVVKSAKYPDSLVGEGLRGVVMAEAAKMKSRIYDKYIRPTLADYRGWLLASSTPEGKDSWFYDLYMRGQDPARTDWESWKIPSWENPYVYPGGGSWEAVKLLREYDRLDGVTPERLARIGLDSEIADMLLDMTEEAFNQEVGADFNEFVGRVFKRFEEEIHVTDLKLVDNPRWHTFAATDYGFTNPNVWLLGQVDTWGNVYIVHEYYERNRTIDEMAADIRERGLCPPACRTLYPDPEDPGSSRFLANRFGLRIAGGTGGRIRDRIDLIRAALKPVPAHLPADHPEKKPRLLIDRRCVETIREMSSYKYPENRRSGDSNSPENPEKKNDHAPEALGRFFAGYFGVNKKRDRKTQLTTAKVG